MTLFYSDASALVKLVRDEPESSASRTYLANADLITCELVVIEIPRAARRAAHDAQLPLDRLLQRADELLDAMHVCAATSVTPLDAFVTYDERQAAAARLAGLRTTAPGSCARATQAGLWAGWSADALRARVPSAMPASTASAPPSPSGPLRSPTR